MGALVDINTDGLAKLAQTIGNWLGLEARAIERNAEAEAYAYVRKVDAENAANLIRLQGEEQVANYIIAREKRKLNNVQSIVSMTQEQFIEGEKVSDEPVNPDWLNRFFSIVEDVSDSEMQKLWAQILAGEVKRPKSYSLRTLELLRNISKEEALEIQDASRYYINALGLCTEQSFGANLLLQSKMDELGIICGENLTYHLMLDPNNEPIDIIIGKTRFLRMYPKNKTTIKLRHYTITKIGEEIFTLTNKDDLAFALQLAKHLKTEEISKIAICKIDRWEEDKYYTTTEEYIELKEI